MGTGYEGNRIEKDGNKYEFKGNRKKSIHGLFGSIDYKRAYYVGANNTGGSYISLDVKLGIRKKHKTGARLVLSINANPGSVTPKGQRFMEKAFHFESIK